MGFRSLLVNGRQQVPFRPFRLRQSTCKFFHVLRRLVPPPNVAFDKRQDFLEEFFQIAPPGKVCCKTAEILPPELLPRSLSHFARSWKPRVNPSHQLGTRSTASRNAFSRGGEGRRSGPASEDPRDRYIKVFRASSITKTEYHFRFTFAGAISDVRFSSVCPPLFEGLRCASY